MAALLFVALLATPAPPVAPRHPQTLTLHGEARRDDYAWLRNRDDPAVRAYLEAENRYTDAMTRASAPFRDKLYAEALARIKETDSDVEVREGRFYYYSRTVAGQQYPIHARKEGDLGAPEQVILDENELARGQPFMAVDALSVSDDGNLLAYTTDDVGYRQYTLHIKDLRSGALLPDTAARVDSVAWAADGRTLFYVVESEPAKRAYRLVRHTLGEPAARDAVIYEEPDERFSLEVRRTRSRAYILLAITSHTSSEVRALRADQPEGAFATIVPRAANVEYSVDHGGDLFYLVINDRGRNFRLVSAPVADPRPERWRELIAARADVMLERVDAFADFLVLTERADAVSRLVIRDLASGASRVIDMPEEVYEAQLGDNRVFDTQVLRYHYESLVTPPSDFDYAVQVGVRSLRKRQEVGRYNLAQYVSERVHATAADGTQVPISLVRRREVARDGRAACLLEGYGAYGDPYGVEFSSPRVSYLDRGVVYAIAHVRGGGDLGKTWHDGGRMMNKMNTFTDFIAAAEELVRAKVCARGRIVIRGTSAGGLLIGAVTNLRPDLFKAVVARVPFVDVINTMLDPTLPLTVEEFEEWGNPTVKAEYEYMRRYSPYDNVAHKRYPAMLVRTSWSDSQVGYWEPAKWVARLRAMKTDRNVLLLRVTMAGGHGGASGRYEELRDWAFDAAFVLGQMGIGK